MNDGNGSIGGEKCANEPPGGGGQSSEGQDHARRTDYSKQETTTTHTYTTLNNYSKRYCTLVFMWLYSSTLCNYCNPNFISGGAFGKTVFEAIHICYRFGRCCDVTLIGGTTETRLRVIPGILIIFRVWRFIRIGHAMDWYHRRRRIRFNNTSCT